MVSCFKDVNLKDRIQVNQIDKNFSTKRKTNVVPGFQNAVSRQRSKLLKITYQDVSNNGKKIQISCSIIACLE